MMTIFSLGRGNRVPGCGARMGLAKAVGPTFAGVLFFLALSWPLEAAAVHHVVQEGDTLSGIAVEYGTTVAELVALNGLKNPDLLRVGQKLVVREEAPAPEAFVHVVQRGETLSEIAAGYGVSTSQLAALNGIANPDRIWPGLELVVVPQAVQHRVKRGENLSTIAQSYGVTVQSIALLNGLRDPNRLAVGQVLTIPPTGGAVAEVLAQVRPLFFRRSLSRWPVQGTVTSNFGPRDGRMHEGIDIAVPQGTVVRAVAAGQVVYADWAGSYGLLVRIDHGGGVETRYAHNSRLLVKAGDVVREGDALARSGSTGRSTGPHVHFEVRVDGEAIDPRPWLP